MAGLRQLFAVAIITVGIFFLPDNAFASRKATDLMSEALRQRTSGNLTEAISSFESAYEKASTPMQKNLARFMLGDCQLEAGKFSDAITTFTELSESVTSSEEKAEALFRLMQAHSGLGNKSRVSAIFSQIRSNHRSSPYCELAGAFMKTEGLKEIEDAPLPVKQTAVAVVSDPVMPDPSPVHVEAEPEKVAVAEVSLRTKSEPDAETKLESEPETKLELKPGKDVPAQVPASSGLKKVNSDTATLLNSILNVEKAVGSEKEELVSKILGYQDSLKDGPDKPGMDQVLIDLAESTTRFGELLEACKIYDKVLTYHPTSPLVEKAYYEAIRLRAVLGVHEAVIGWSKAFVAAFPASQYRSKIRALVEYSQAGGKLNLTGGAKASTGLRKTDASPSVGDNDSANAALAADSQFVSASGKMKDGKYNLALVDFNRLSKQHPSASQIWWNIALVHVQLEDFKKAAQAINKMLQLDPGNQDANSLSGYIHYRLENYEEAASAYDQAGEPEGRGVTFFDAKTASERMKKSAGSK